MPKPRRPGGHPDLPPRTVDLPPRPVAEEIISPLAERNLRLIQAFLETGNADEAAKRVGISHQHAGRLLRARAVTALIAAAFARHGITADRIAQTISNALMANTTTVMVVGKGETKQFTYADHPTRLRAARLAVEMADRYEDRLAELEDRIEAGDHTPAATMTTAELVTHLAEKVAEAQAASLARRGA